MGKRDYACVRHVSIWAWARCVAAVMIHCASVVIGGGGGGGEEYPQRGDIRTH